MTLRALFCATLLGFAAHGAAIAHEFKAGDIAIAHPWARATVTGQPSGGGFLKLDNRGADDTLLSVRADISETAEIHTMEMKDNIMRMRQVEGIAVPAGKAVELKPGGYHIMFMKLKAPLKQGTTFPATLTFQKAGEVKVEFKVEAINYQAAPATEHKHAH